MPGTRAAPVLETAPFSTGGIPWRS